MALDASIALRGKLPELDSPLTTLAQVSQLKQAQQQNRLADMAYGEKQRATEYEGQRRNALASSMNRETGEIDAPKYRSALAGNGDYEGLQTFQKHEGEKATAQRAADKAQLEAKLKRFEVAGQIMGPVRDQASWEMARQQTAELFGPEVAAQMPAQYDPRVVEQKRQQAMPVKEQLEQEWKAKGYNLDVAKFGEVARHNTATEGAAAGNLAVAQGALNVSRGNLAVNQTREGREATMPRGQIVQSEQGTMLVDPRTGQAQPVMANGQPMTPKLKDLPAPIQKAQLENNAALTKIDSALAAVTAYPDGLGVKNYLGDSIRQRSDPNGVDVRALVADIGSLKIHDRSGAAVTASETPRLMPFIPNATDNSATVTKKLNLFKKEYAAINDDIAATYTREQGYKTPQQKVKDAVDNGAVDKLNGLKPVSVQSPADYHKLPSGTVYTDPKGTQRTKP